ncbi:G-patch domain and KOW motifs-containing protein isoform X1 [Bombyx mori]|uniref:Spp2/MOS2 G-patch domain-containing protein n=1 Tax=Bombyx mori TaxID=7091 RepID=A0A8R2AVC7_BOMMO|nr:G-patch domain and KOW motifs-containing protein isoform X1 [Bombyx mori]
MEGKKISFGFMKTKKAEKPVVDEKKDYIECVEEKSIKVVGAEEIKDDTPLIIPMKPNTLITTERLKQIAQKVESALDEPEVVKSDSPKTVEIPENETLEQMAVRELMEDTKKKVKIETSAITVPLPAKPVTDGEKESTLDDYDSVPIQDFGMAMLRGMGWTPNKDLPKYKQPQLRPKGLGLGADKVVSDKKKTSKDKNGEELTIVKNSFVKITTGKYSGYYGKVLSLDEDNGRAMVNIVMKNETVNLSEFMMHPVTKSEFDKESKVINADKYEKYKKDEKVPQSSKEKDIESSPKRETKKEKYEHTDRREREDWSNGKNRKEDRHRRDSSSTGEERSQKKKKHKKRYSSNESLSSQSEDERRRRKKDKKKRERSVDSEDEYKKNKGSATPDGKRDIDKKRKGKKKKRDRDRSPNYKKHRK